MPRRIKHRSAARLLVVADDHVLLQHDSDPGIPGARWWITPGGGIDEGETPEQAAVRELYEETGLVLGLDALMGPVATRHVRHGYSDRILFQHEVFFRVEVDRFDADPVGFTASELERVVGQEWFPLHALPDPVWPATLGRLLAWTGGEPIDLGEMDESTLD